MHLLKTKRILYDVLVIHLQWEQQVSKSCSQPSIDAESCQLPDEKLSRWKDTIAIRGHVIRRPCEESGEQGAWGGGWGEEHLWSDRQGGWKPPAQRGLGESDRLWGQVCGLAPGRENYLSDLQ